MHTIASVHAGKQNHSTCMVYRNVIKSDTVGIHRQEFEEFISEKYLQGRASGSIVVTKARADEVKLFLQGKGKRGDKTFTHWVKRRKFQLINYPALGLNNTLCTPVKDKV